MADKVHRGRFNTKAAIRKSFRWSSMPEGIKFMKEHKDYPNIIPLLYADYKLMIMHDLKMNLAATKSKLASV